MSNPPTLKDFNQTAERLANDPILGKYMDRSIEIPEPLHGNEPIRLVILGQDPTVKNPQARKTITQVLNLNKSGSLKSYLRTICGLLGVNLGHEVYATNLYKNFFIQEPTHIEAVDIFHGCLPYWLPVLRAELAAFPDIPVLTLGEPLLSTIVYDEMSGKVRDYWGYRAGWKRGDQGKFASLEPEQTFLNRRVLPFPHQPSWQRKKFYSDRLAAYCAYARLYIS